MKDENKQEYEASDVNLEPEEDQSRLVEDEAELGDLGAAQAKLKKFKDELAKLKLERQEYLDGWQRCKADSVNARRETLQNAERAGARALESFVEELIPALDGFDMAMGSEVWESVDAPWRSGIEHIRNNLLEVLSRHGVERFGKVGDILDPKLHEAVQEIADVPGEPHSIVRILRFGYKSGKRILRAAQVIIKSGERKD